jgi:Rrf2 family nitric oxide-sensitive transcriptional repressor
MKLTAFTDYSLRVLMYLGLQDGRLATVSEVATAFDISEHHLTKVVHFLGKEGLLQTTRGKGGGLALAHRPREIRVGDVVRRTEGESIAAECFEPEGGACCLVPACRLRGVLAEAFEAFYKVLDRYTLADLVKNRDELIALLPPVEWIPLIAAPRPAARAGSRA